MKNSGDKLGWGQSSREEGGQRESWRGGGEAWRWKQNGLGPAACNPTGLHQYLIGLLLAHGQRQLQLQLLLPAALRPGLLCLGRGPGAHSCGGS